MKVPQKDAEAMPPHSIYIHKNPSAFGPSTGEAEGRGERRLKK